jgi:hypothetical protein
VIAECLAHALDVGEAFGVWGGLSESDRQRLLNPVAHKRATVSFSPARHHSSVLPVSEMGPTSRPPRRPR